MSRCTGLTWTNHAGARLDTARSVLQAETPKVATQLTDPPAPSSAERLSIDGATAASRTAGLSGPLQLTPPAESGTAWTVKTEHRQWPVERTSVAIDPATGQVTDGVEWADYPLLAKATVLGILFHQAELFGLANQIALTMLALGLVVLMVVGYVMWWQRRPAGAFGAPPRVGPLLRTVPIPLLGGFALLMVALPTLGVSFLAYLLIEQIVRAMHRAPA